MAMEIETTTTTSSTPIATVPAEVLQQTLTHCHPRDVAAFSQTCRFARDVIYSIDHQNYLWRTLFLSYPFDDPRPWPSLVPSLSKYKGDASSFDWRKELMRRVRAEYLATEDMERQELFNVLLDTILQATPVLPEHWTPKGFPPSPSLEWASRIVESSSLLHPYPSWSEIDYFGHLRALFAQTILTDKTSRHLDLRLHARTYVYDLRNYIRSREWGPFCDFHDGTIEEEDEDDLEGMSTSTASLQVSTPDPLGPHQVDWVHVSALAIVIASNLRDIDERWPDELVDKPPLLVKGLEATRAYSARGTHPDVRANKDDWAGVEGNWLRIVCFCDYRDLIRFNANGCRPSFFDNDIDEATRLLSMTLKFDCLETDPHILATLPDPSRPPIKFKGMMRGVGADENGGRQMRGTVRVMKDGNIRWTFISRYDGEDQWSSEGVQIGNVCSAAGVVGAWTGVHHGRGDPAGPFWFWKTDREIPRPPWPE